MVNFPLSLTSSSLTLFKITALQTSTDHRNLHVCTIQGLPRYVANSATEDWYLEFDSMAKLENGIYLIERNPMALKHKLKPSCLLAFLEVKEKAFSNFANLLSSHMRCKNKF
jgi:replication initiation and membrane attachment protein DnaB